MRIILSLLSAIVIITSCQKESATSFNKSNADLVSAANFSSATVALPGDCNYTFQESSLGGYSGWTNVLDENFTNLNNWNVWTGGAYNNELQLYQSSNLVVGGSDLSIVVKKESKVGPITPGNTSTKKFNYTSGRIESKALFSACSATPKVRLSARIKLPAGYGMWPAFWTYGDPWPTQGEIDILEAKGQEPTIYYTNYFYGTTANTNLVSGATSKITSSVSLQSCYHVYEMIWEQNSLKFYLDGQLVNTKTGGYVSNLFNKQEKITLNVAVGGNFFTGLIASKIVPGTMVVDWVKVYTSN